jgi:predicted nuclease of predicted toxin-antitoxin system
VRWLIDNNVPRAVTWLRRDRGYDAVEVREILGPAALDLDIGAYAVAQQRIVVTHDRGMARRCRAAAEPHVWLRCPEPDDRRHLEAHLQAIVLAATQPGLAVVVSSTGTIEFKRAG